MKAEWGRKTDSWHGSLRRLAFSACCLQEPQFLSSTSQTFMFESQEIIVRASRMSSRHGIRRSPKAGDWPGSLCGRWYDVEHGERSRSRADGATSLGCVCGTTGKAFCLEMGLQVRWFQNIQERAWSLDVVLLVSTWWVVGQKRANWPRQPFSAEPLCRESLLLSVPPCPG